jgi:hypothetical protein
MLLKVQDVDDVYADVGAAILVRAQDPVSACPVD